MIMPSKRQRCYTTGLFLLLLQCMTVSPLSFSKEWNRRDVLQITSSVVLGAAPAFLSPSGRVEAAAANDDSTNAAAAAATPYLMKEYYTPAPTTAASYGRFFFPALTPPFANRATYRYQLGRDAWALEQLLTFANVTATIRTNVIRMQDGGLWVHSPQWPTGEFCHLLDELGPVRYVVLPCNAFEHKAPMAAFCKKYPDASVWISPGQYGPFGSCGLDLLSDCNMGYKVDGVLTANQSPPWSDEFDYSTFYVSTPGNAGPVSEVAFYHRPSQTLVATDAVAFIPDGPAPHIFTTYFDNAVVVEPTFWPRTVLQSVFLPLRTASRSASAIDANANTNTNDVPVPLDLDLYYPGFDAIRNRLIRAPILRGFTDARAPAETRAWIATITDSKKWNYDRIITCHFASPVAATPAMVRKTFSFLEEEDDDPGSNKKGFRYEPPIACQDWELLNTLNDVIAKNKLGAPASFDYTRGCLEE